MSLAFGRIYSSLRATIVVGIFVPSLAATSRAEHCVALLIDNSGYRGGNARPTEGVDGKAFGVQLAELGFRTRILFDLDETRLSAAIEEFARGVPTRGAAQVYFHGLSVPAENDDRRLLGIDVDLRSLQVGEKGCVVSRVLGLLEASGATRPTVFVGGFSLIGGSIEPVRSFFPNSGADLRNEYRARASTVTSSPEKLLPGRIPGAEWVARGGAGSVRQHTVRRCHCECSRSVARETFWAIALFCGGNSDFIHGVGRIFLYVDCWKRTLPLRSRR